MFKIDIWESSSEDAVCSANITQFSNQQMVFHCLPLNIQHESSFEKCVHT